MNIKALTLKLLTTLYNVSIYIIYIFNIFLKFAECKIKKFERFY